MSTTSAAALLGTTPISYSNQPVFEPRALLKDQTPINLPRNTSPESKVKVDSSTTYGSAGSERPVTNGTASTDVVGIQTQTVVTAPLGRDTNMRLQNIERDFTGTTTTQTTNPRTGALQVRETPFDQSTDIINLGVTQNLTPDKKSNPQVTVGVDVQRATTENNVTGATTVADRARMTSQQTFQVGPDTKLQLNESVALVNSRTDSLPLQQTVQVAGSARLTQQAGSSTTLFVEGGARLNHRLDSNVPVGVSPTTLGAYVQAGVTQKITPSLNIEVSGWAGNGPGTDPFSPSLGGGEGSSVGGQAKLAWRF